MTFLIAHLSDPHVGPLPRIPFRNLINKRLTGVLNWHGARATIHNMAVLDRVIDDILSASPDHVALTGDLVNVGYAPEFPLAMRHIERLGGPEHVSIIPGNHDAYVPGSLQRMTEACRPFMQGDGAKSVAALPEFPYLRVRGNVALIGINTGVPTLPFVASGLIGRAQRARLEAMLETTRRQGLFRVLMIHHPPLARGAKFGRGLMDSRQFTRILARHGAELVLHGHNHRFSMMETPGPAGAIPVIGVASASAVPGTPHHCAEWNAIRIATGPAPEIRIERRGIRPGDFTLRPIGDAIVIKP